MVDIESSDSFNNINPIILDEPINETKPFKKNNTKASMLVSNVLESSFDNNKSVSITKEKIWNVVRKIKKNKKEYKNKLKQDKWYIINPRTSIFRLIFDIVIMLLLISDFVLSPFEYFVTDKSTSFYREYIFDSIFFIEIILNFFTGYYDYSLGFVITDMKKIAIHFLKYGFIFDVIFISPLYLINPVFLLIRLIKLYRYPHVLSNIKKYLNTFFSLFISNLKLKQQIIQLILFFLSLVYILHLCSCIYVFIGHLYEKGTWISLVFDGERTIKEEYIASMYQITQTFTTTGYGDVHPVTNIEIMFIIFCEIVNCGLFAYLLTCILEILTNKEDSLRFKYQNAKIDVTQWARMYMSKLPQSSKEKNLHRDDIWVDVKRFFEIYYFNEKNFSWIKEFEFMKQIKPRHRKELLERAFFNIRIKFRMFFNLILTERGKNDIILNFKTKIEKKGYPIIDLYQEIKKIYFIEQGGISIFKNGQQIKELNEGDTFGIEGLLHSNSNYQYKVSSNCDFAIVYSIDISFLINEILNYDAESFTEVMNYAHEYVNEIKKISTKDVIQIIKDNNEAIINTNKDSNRIQLVGNLPEKMETNERVKKIMSSCEECEMRLNLITKQLLFIENYIKDVI